MDIYISRSYHSLYPWTNISPFTIHNSTSKEEKRGKKNKCKNISNSELPPSLQDQERKLRRRKIEREKEKKGKKEKKEKKEKGTEKNQKRQQKS